MSVRNFSSTASLPTIAVFDFDGTLTRRDSLFPFLKFISGKGRFYWKIFLLTPTLLRYSLGLLPNWQAKEAVLTRFLKGLTAEQLQQFGHRFATRIIPKLLRPEAMARLRWHQKQGHQTILLSASLEIYLVPWGKVMAFDKVLGTRLLLHSSGTFSGYIEGKNCYGSEKVKRLQEFLGDFDHYVIYAYGDSKGDQELLTLATYSYYRTFMVLFSLFSVLLE
jgi:HAD superfamily hydrolase (TIGR01490 family)